MSESVGEEWFQGFRRFVVSVRSIDESPSWGPGQEMRRTVIQASDASVAAQRGAELFGVAVERIEVSAI